MTLSSIVFRQFWLATTLAAWFCVQAFVPAIAADEKSKPSLGIELNDLAQRPDACRLTLLIENRLGVSLSELNFELVIFGKDQRIMQLLAIVAGSFPERKSRVKQFDLKAVACADISRILLNSITRCTGGALTPDICLAATRTATRLTVPLSY